MRPRIGFAESKAKTLPSAGPSPQIALLTRSRSEVERPAGRPVGWRIRRVSLRTRSSGIAHSSHYREIPKSADPVARLRGNGGMGFAPRKATVLRLPTGTGRSAGNRARASIDPTTYLPIRIPSEDEVLDAELVVPAHALGLVVVVPDDGTVRRVDVARGPADRLAAIGFAVLRVDLRSGDDRRRDATADERRFDLDVASRRLADVVAWARSRDATATLRVGLLGMGTGAAAALSVASAFPDAIGGVVACEGRPDLVAPALAGVRAPTRLVVARRDAETTPINEGAYGRLRCRKDLLVIPGTARLLEDPRVVEDVARACADWFTRTLAPVQPAAFA
jgi:putative phosphoribosyl transferase